MADDSQDEEDIYDVEILLRCIGQPELRKIQVPPSISVAGLRARVVGELRLDGQQGAFVSR